jgi:large subunit ribosomal protein L6
MSRIGKLPVKLPPKVTASVSEGIVKVNGPKGELTKTFSTTHVSIALDNGEIIVSPANSSRLSKAMHGTARSIINSMVNGVVNGYERNLEIEGVGFKAAVNGSILDLALGYSHPINYPIPAGIKVVVDANTKLKVTGIDKHLVGQVAADIYQYYPVEPYKGKGVRIVGQYVRRKEGKKAG